MKILICAGGTGGHIYPALTLARKLKELGHEIDFIGSNYRLEKEIITKTEFNFIGLNIKSFGKNPISIAKGILNFFINLSLSFKIVKKYDLIFGFGNYISIPVLIAGKIANKKLAIHEQNAIPGKANILLSKIVDIVFCSFDENLKYFKNKNIDVVGNPQSSVAYEINDEEYIKSFNLDNNLKVVLIFFGSLGSMSMDKIMQEYLADFNENFQVIYVTGEEYYQNYQNYHNDKVIIRKRVEAYKLMNVVDLLVVRSGATTISEITSIGIPSILIPSPYVANNHQFYNAKALVDKDGAVILEERNIDKKILASMIKNTINNDELLAKLKSNSLKIGSKNASKLIIERIEKLC